MNRLLRLFRDSPSDHLLFVTPAQAGVHHKETPLYMDSRLRGNDVAWKFCRLLCAFVILARICGGVYADPQASLSPNTTQKLIEFRRELHRHPELSNRETETMQRIAKYLAGIGISDVKTRVAKTGVVATLKGGKPGPTIAIRAPIDAFPVQEKRETPYKSQVPNVSHACGHDAMTAMALGAAEILAAHRDQIVGTVKFIFQPAEEGAPEGEEGGAPLMVKEGVADGISAIIAFHVDPYIPAGDLGLHLSTVYAGADTLHVTVHGEGAHGATPWKGVDAIAVAGQIISGIQLITSRQTDIFQPIVLTIGTVQGGVRSNAIAGQVDLTGTLRTYSEPSRRQAQKSLSAVVSHIAEAFGAKAELRLTEPTAPVVNDADLVKRLRPVLESAVGPSHLKIMQPLPYADDFSSFSEKAPSLYFQIGVRNEKKGITASTHTETFDVDEDAIPLGARLLADLALGIVR